MRVPLAAVAVLLIPHGWAPSPSHQQIGTVRFPVSCTVTAQPHFNRAVALLHSFAFSQAVEAFTGVLRIDPQCAMAYWGLGLSAWGNPFLAANKLPAQIQNGLEAVTRARRIGAPTERERRYLDAVAHLYEHADSVDQRTRLLAYRDAMADLAAREPADTEAAIFHALALAASADPADKTYASQLAAGATLERLFAARPDHPGLAHYLIHSYDVPALADRALEAAHRYGHIAPAVSHALHMPSHTYTRMGAWQESIDANVASARAARREGATAEELHASDYRTYAYLQIGQDAAVAGWSPRSPRWRAGWIPTPSARAAHRRQAITPSPRSRPATRWSGEPGLRRRDSRCIPARCRSRMRSPNSLGRQRMSSALRSVR